MTMPSRNILKLDAAEEYYHVYARGCNKQVIFIDATDCAYFLSLFERYLTAKVHHDRNGLTYPTFHGKVELLCYCLMRNHFHLLIYQRDIRQIRSLMQCLMSSYVRYFNTKYKRRGPLFESRYKAASVRHEAYFQHISRYIHLNPFHWERYPYSSLPYYFCDKPDRPEWLLPQVIESQFENKQQYWEFLHDYKEGKAIIDAIKDSLADH